MTDRNEVKKAYIAENCSLKELGKRFGLSPRTIGRRSAAENWRLLRQEHSRATLERALDLLERSQAEKLARMEEVSQELLARVSEAIGQLDLQVLREIRKERDILYENSQRPDKPTKEISVERETLTNLRTPIDRNGIKLLAAALKDIKEVQMLRNPSDIREQEAKIAKLLRESKEEPPDHTLEITFPPELHSAAE